MMFQDEEREALQALLDNHTITLEDQLTPTRVLTAIQTSMKEDEHFWHYRDELLSDFRQKHQEGIHSLNNRITQLINNCKFNDSTTKDTLKLMLLAHAVKYHKARDWVRLQDQSKLTYQTLLNHCKLLEQRCEQFKKAQMKGRAQLTTITAASSGNSSIHQDTINKHPRHLKCSRCGYNHPIGNCPASGQQCYNCNGIGHYTALCKKPRQCRHNRSRSRYRPRTSSNRRHPSISPSRSRPSRKTSRSPSRKQPRSPHRSYRHRRSPTPHVHQVSHILHLAPKHNDNEGNLVTDTASDGQTSFHTTLQVITKQGTKPIQVKVDPGAAVNTIPLSRYKKLFKKNLTKAGHVKNNVLHPTSHSWSSHDKKPQPFIGYFIIDVHHKTLSKTMQVRFYVFEDTTSPPLPGAAVNTIPLSCYKKLFKKNLTKAGHIKNNVLHPTSHSWSSHDKKPQPFIGYFIIDVHHKTLSKTMQVRFYVFEDTTSPPLLLSYEASERLGIIEFKVPNEAILMAAIDTISTKRVTFSTPLHTSKTRHLGRPSNAPLKSAIKNKPFQDHLLQTTENKLFQDQLQQQSSQHHKTIKNNAFQDQSTQNNATNGNTSQNHSLQDHPQKPIGNHSFQDHFTTANVKDIFSIKQAFPTSFDTVGNMPGKYSIKIDTTVPTVQHARCKVPIHYKEEIERKLLEMEQLQIIAPVTTPTEWVSSITYPTKQDGSLRICLDPRDLNKAIIREHYKAPTLEEISHRLSGATVFSKMDAKNGFWSIHLDTPSSYLTTFNMHKGRYRFLRMPFGLKMSQDVFQMRMDNITERLEGIISIHDDICIFGKTQQEHDENLLQLMKTAQKNSLVFNSSKCTISQPHISFYGAIFSAKGMKPDPKKCKPYKTSLHLTHRKSYNHF